MAEKPAHRRMFHCSAPSNAEQNAHSRRSLDVSDITDYLLAYARRATMKARRMRRSTANRNRQRVVARVYHLLAKEATYTSNVKHLDDFRAAQRLERSIDRS
jgi:hypothetical protein